MNKRRITIIVILVSIILAVVAITSSTYALFYNEKVASNKNEYSTGLLSIEATSKTNTISLDNAIPMEDSEGVETKPYVFTITNKGNLDYTFNVRLLSTSSNTINPSYIKLKIDDASVTTLSTLTNSTIKSNLTLKAKESIDIEIRVWLAINTPNTEIGKSFTSNLVIDGQAVYTEPSREDEIYTVTFDPNGGSLGTQSSTKQVVYGSTYGNLPTPTRTGYTFKGWSILPSGYQEVEYLQSSGTQYIDTNLYPTQDYAIDLTIKYGNYGFSFGELDIQGHDKVFYISQAGSGTNSMGQVGFGDTFVRGTDESKYVLNTDENVHTYTLKNAIFYEDGVEKISIPNTLSQFTSNRTLLIFATHRYNSGTLEINKRGGILYNLEIYDNNIPIRNFIPCYNKTTLVRGLYDAVNDEFYTNAGTGSFEIGNDVPITDNSKIINSTNVTQQKNHTLTAIWEKATPTVTLDANGGTIPSGNDWTGSGSSATKQVTYDSTYGNLPTPTRTGYTFKGWITENLVTNAEFEQGGITDAGGTNANNMSNRIRLKDYLHVSPNATYIINVNDNSVDNKIKVRYTYLYNNGSFIGVAGTYGISSSQFETPSNCSGIRVVLQRNDSTTNILPSDLSSINVEILEYITNKVTVVQDKNHTLKAIWEQN